MFKPKRCLPLLLAAAALAAGFAAEEVSLITEDSPEYVLKFKTVELWQTLRQKLA